MNYIYINKRRNLIWNCANCEMNRMNIHYIYPGKREGGNIEMKNEIWKMKNYKMTSGDVEISAPLNLTNEI